MITWTLYLAAMTVLTLADRSKHMLRTLLTPSTPPSSTPPSPSSVPSASKLAELEAKVALLDTQPTFVAWAKTRRILISASMDAKDVASDHAALDATLAKILRVLTGLTVALFGLVGGHSLPPSPAAQDGPLSSLLPTGLLYSPLGLGWGWMGVGLWLLIGYAAAGRVAQWIPVAAEGNVHAAADAELEAALVKAAGDAWDLTK